MGKQANACLRSRTPLVLSQERAGSGRREKKDLGVIKRTGRHREKIVWKSGRNETEQSGPKGTNTCLSDLEQERLLWAAHAIALG